MKISRRGSLKHPAHLPFPRALAHFIRYKKFYLVFLLLIILISPYLIRYLNHNPTIIGESSYFHLSQAEKINKYNFYQNPYALLLSLNFPHYLFIYLAVPLILALLSFFLLVNLLKKIKLSAPNRFFFLLFLILSPSFIYTFTILNHYSFFIFLNLLGFTLLLQQKKFLYYLSFPVFAVVPFFDVFSSILTLLLLETYFYFKHRPPKTKERPWWNMKYLRKDNFAKTLLTVLLILTLVNIFLQKRFLLGPYSPQNTLLDLFSDLGGLFGLSLFSLLLAIIGLTVVWKKEKVFLAYFFLPLLLFFFVFQTTLLIYLNFIVVLLASFGFTYLLHKEWKLEAIKNISLFLIILGLLFSTLTCLNGLSSLPPSPEIKESLFSLKEKTSPDRMIFSHPRDSYLIEYFSQRPAFIHYHDSDFKTKMNVTNQILHSTYIKETFPLLEQNNISYIYLSPQTKDNLPTDKGLIFLFQNERFKKIYDWKDIEIWKFES